MSQPIELRDPRELWPPGRDYTTMAEQVYEKGALDAPLQLGRLTRRQCVDEVLHWLNCALIAGPADVNAAALRDYHAMLAAFRNGLGPEPTKEGA